MDLPGEKSHATVAKMIHFLHIGKTGGSAIKAALSQAQLDGLQLHPHRVRLADIPRGDGVIFFVRNPITRFVSGFYSRQRQGRPRYNSRWSKDEAAAFSMFHTPDHLASALSASDVRQRAAAHSAMQSIEHVRSTYYYWIGSNEALLERMDDIFIGLQEELAADYDRLRQRLGVPVTIGLPTDDTQAHRNPAALDKSLCDVSLRNLRAWYEKDIEFYRFCRELRQRFL